MVSLRIHGQFHSRQTTAWHIVPVVTLIFSLMPVSVIAQDRPNIVFVLMDDLDRATVTALPPVMPNVSQRIATAGATFTRAFANVPLCAPSRATILSGRYAQNTKVRQNWYPPFHVNGAERSTVAVWLKAAGYRTALFGKYLNGYPDRLPSITPTFVPPGWTDWAVPVASDAAGYTLNENGRLVAYDQGNAADYFTDVLARKSLDFVRSAAQSGAPFFLMLTPTAPHRPAIPAPRHAKLFADKTLPRGVSFNEADVDDKPPFLRLPAITPARIRSMEQLYRQRLRSLQAVDEAVRDLHALIQSLGLASRTYFVVASDNGFHQGQHRLTDGMGGGKETGFAEDLHLPLLVSGPGIPPGLQVHGLVTLADLAPTFAAWASAGPAPRVDGRSLVPLLRAGPPPAWRNWLPLRHLKPSGAGATNPAQTFLGVRTAGYSYLEYPDYGLRDLYDMQADPWQLVNLATVADPGLLARLSQATTALATCSGSSCWSLEDAPAP